MNGMKKVTTYPVMETGACRSKHPPAGWGRLCVPLFAFFILFSCAQDKPKANPEKAEDPQENKEAKAMLQGTWLDAETEEVFMRAVGDTVFFEDAGSLPAYFRIVGDSIQLGPDTYAITKQTEHNFWFRNHAGSQVQLQKRDDSMQDVDPEPVPEKPKTVKTSQAISNDSVVMYGAQRYHWYVTVNPTRHRVTRTTYTPDGVAVEKVFYDNLIHLSLFKGNNRIFTRNFMKKDFAADVPEDFLSEAILGDISYSHTNADGFHFHATVCLPEGEKCYMIELIVAFDSKLSMRLME